MALTRPRQSQLRDSDYKNSCRVVTVSDITLSGGAPTTVDGVNLQVSDRILVTAQTDASENGVYLVNTVGSGSDGTWQRSLDFNSNAVVTSGALVPITEGISYANTLWRLTTADPITINTTNLTFVNNILTDVVQDTTPQLGGNLDGQAFNITTTGTGTFGTMTDGTVSFTSGNINTDPTATTVGTSATSVDTFSASTYRGAKYMVTVANGTDFDIVESLVVHNGTTATITVYGEVSTNTSLGDLTTDISSGNVRLLYTGGATGNSVKVFATYIT